MPHTPQSAAAGGSFHFRARFDVFQERDEASDFTVACREDHALRLDAHQLRRLQVGNDDDSFSNQGLRFVLLSNAGDDLPLLRTLSKTNLQLEQLLRFWDALGAEDLRRRELNLQEVGDGALSRRDWCGRS